MVLSKKMGFVLMEKKCEQNMQLNFRKLEEELKARTSPIC